jgi:hypothetical protein
MPKRKLDDAHYIMRYPGKCDICGCAAHKRHHFSDYYTWVILVNHHIIPKRFGGSNDPSNKIRFCSECHSQIHRLYEQVAISMAFKADPDFFRKCLTTLKQEGVSCLIMKKEVI